MKELDFWRKFLWKLYEGRTLKLLVLRILPRKGIPTPYTKDIKSSRIAKNFFLNLSLVKLSRLLEKLEFF